MKRLPLGRLPLRMRIDLDPFRFLRQLSVLALVLGMATVAFGADSVGPDGMRVVCDDGICRLVPEESPDAEAPSTTLFPGFRVRRRNLGGMDAPQLAAWLGGADATDGPSPRDPPARGAVALLLAAFVAGVLLNASPCVLPMIPVTLAVLGAGAGSRRRGALLGAAYGLGITAAYGALGLVCLTTGRALGTLQSSPWFLGGAALLLAVFGLSLLGVLPLIDLTRLASRPAAPAGAGGLAAAFGAGVGFALLAGACIAPVMLGTLVAAVSLQSSGNALGFALPFVLGAGLGAPWILLGAGMGRWLPRPGAWLRWVERLFGVLLLAMALRYAGHAATRLSRDAGGGAPDDASIPWRTDLATAVAEARATGRPLFVYGWATWCGVCGELSRTTFRDPAAVRALEGLVALKVQCEDPTDPLVEHFFDELGFDGPRGLPALAILDPIP